MANATEQRIERMVEDHERRLNEMESEMAAMKASDEDDKKPPKDKDPKK